MTRARKGDLVIAGHEVALRLKAERMHTKSVVHVDWVRFTVKVKNAPLPDVKDLFPSASDTYDSVKKHRMATVLAALPDPDFAVSAQAKELAEMVCNALGPDFCVEPELRKGHDFYRFRWSIVRNEVECGWVGFLASGESPRQQAQASTMHCNLYGTACTFARPGFNHRVAQIVRDTDATITRIDLALDFFDGIKGGMDRVRSDYVGGLMDNRGRRPSCNLVGDWCNGRARSFYTGSKEAGKQTNTYEKGHQLYGPKDDSPWVRIEVRWGNKLRVLDAEVLNHPQDFFAAAGDWHCQMLKEADAEFVRRSLTTTARLAIESISAEVSRNVRWALNTAAPTLAVLFKHADESTLMGIFENQKLPGRLAKFTQSEIASTFASSIKRIKGSGYGRLGLDPYQMAV